MKTNDGGSYPLLFSPAKIGGLALRNRLVMAPTVVNFAQEDGRPSDRQLEYYRMRAEGGVGLIIVEATFVRSDGRMFSHNLGLDEDTHIPAFRDLAHAIQEGGARAGIQLFHAGRLANPKIIGAQPLGPSPIPCPIRQVMPRELEPQEIADLVQAFEDAGQRAQAAGFDMICLHMAHGYFLHQFLSPLSNQRQDSYGRDFQGRIRLPLEVVGRLRARLGTDYPIFCRISAEEGRERGLKIAETCEIAKALRAAGADLIEASYGSPGSVPLTSATPDFPAGCFLPYAQRIREAAGPPVMAVGRIQDPALAEQALFSGQADLIALARPLLADPDLPRKWREGRQREVRRCTGDNKGCLGRIHKNLDVRCSVNPSLGRVRKSSSSS